MQIVSTNLTGELSLVDHVWNDAMETAALRCEGMADTLRGANGDSENWVWPAASCVERMAADFRDHKRGAVLRPATDVEFTPEEDAYYRKRLIADYARLIEQIDGTMANGVGNTFGLFLTADEGKLVAAAVRTARQHAIGASRKE